MLKNIIKEYNLQINREIYDYVDYKNEGGNTYDYLTKILLLKEEDALRISKRWITIIEKNEYLQYDKLYDDSVKILGELRKDYDLKLVSARKNKQGLYKQLCNLKILDYFFEIEVVSPVNAKNEKILALEKDKNQIALIVGDTEVDCDCAYFYQIPFYCLNRGFRSKNYWEKRGIASFDDLSMIKDVIEKGEKFI